MAYTDREDLNYLGTLLLSGQNRTPFLRDVMLGQDTPVNASNDPTSVDMFANMMARVRTFPAYIFPMTQPYSLASASQPAITEAASVASQTATTITRSQITNTAQIFQETVEVSYAKLSTYGELSGVNVSGEVNPVQNELMFQMKAQMQQIARDMEYSFLNGAYQAASDATTAAKTRGVITASTVNTVDASSAALSVALIDSLVAEMVGNGAEVDGCTIYVNAFQKLAINNLYKYAPQSRSQGGTNIEEIYTTFGRLGVRYSPDVPAGTLLVVDTRQCKPVFVPVVMEDGSRVMVAVESLGKIAASNKWQIYAQAGIDYSHAQFHGTITNLATS